MYLNALYHFYILGLHETTESVVVDKLNTILTKLKPWSNYTLHVAASTGAGEGVPSPPSVCATLQDGQFSKFNKKIGIFFQY